MEEIWMNASRKLEISDDVARTWYEKIRLKMVQGSGRYYHNWDELLLRKKDYLGEISTSSSTIVFAVFFQYFEFDGKRNCVEKNCEAFEEFCSDAGLKDENTIKLVKKLLGDETIDNVPGYVEEINLLQDLDLLVLGSSPEEYKRYRDLLRKEYCHLDDSSYKKMRLKGNEPQASTSKTSSKKSRLSSEKRKTFEKIKDKKYREGIQIYKSNSKKISSSGLNGFPSPSLNQILSKKIVHQIKKRIHQTKNKSPSKIVRTIMKDEKVMESKTSCENLDDDCICIENKTEVILIDDESTAPINVVKELEMKYLKFKQYEPIGKIRMNQANDNYNTQMITSTPNPSCSKTNNNLSRVQFHQDTDSSFGAISSSKIFCNTDDVTIVEDVNCQPNDVIVIDDTIVPQNTRLNRRRKRKRSKNDDSVIFVSENLACPQKPTSSTPAFIPLNTPIEEMKIKLAPISPKSPRPKRQRNELFTTQEEKQLRVYNENAYNPNKVLPKDQSQKRMVIVDGSNVAYQHALNKEFSVKGLKICLDYFAKIGHEVKAVVPQYRLQKQKSSDPNELETLHREGKIVFTPCKNLPGKSSTSYDDRFILQLASELDAAVVSNDNYRDLINENLAFKKIIENRVIGYTWCNDLFILPKDPYGKWGPPLATILNRS